MKSRSHPNVGSWNYWLLSFECGERRYLETTLNNYAAKMRTVNTAKSRRPKCLEGREFSASLFTAISSSKAGDVRYLICIERRK